MFDEPEPHITTPELPQRCPAIVLRRVRRAFLATVLLVVVGSAPKQLAGPTAAPEFPPHQAVAIQPIAGDRSVPDSLGFTLSGAWYHGANGPALLLADVGINDPSRADLRNLLSLSLDGRYSLAANSSPALRSVRFAQFIRPFGNKILVEDEDSRQIRVFDQTLRDTGAVYNVGSARVDGGGQVVVLLDWVPWGQRILGLVYLQRDSGSGLALTTFGRDGAGPVFDWIQDNDPRKRDLAYTGGYLAAVRDRAFFLDARGTREIKRIDPSAASPVSLSPVPEVFRSFPAVEADPRWQSEDRHSSAHGARHRAFIYYDVAERTAMADSLVMHGNRLFLVAKGAAGSSGTTPWWLVELAPATGEELRSLRLPTAASSITLIPPSAGVKTWAIVERDPVGQRSDLAPSFRSRNLVLMPASATAETSSYWMVPTNLARFAEAKATAKAR